MSETHRGRIRLGASARLTINHLFLLALCITTVLPFLWMVLTSLKPFTEVESTTWTPSAWQPANYLNVFEKMRYGLLLGEFDDSWRWHQYFTDSAFMRYYFNSLYVAA